MNWSDIIRWSPDALEQRADDLLALKQHLYDSIDDIDAAERAVLSEGETIEAMLAASGRSRGAVEWLAGLVGRLAAVTDHAGDGVRGVHRLVNDCVDTDSRLEKVTIDSDGSVVVTHYTQVEYPDQTTLQALNNHLDEEAANLQLAVSSALAKAQSVADEYSRGLQSIAGSAVTAYGSGAGAASDGTLPEDDETTRAIEMAELASAIYKDGRARRVATPPGWSVVREDELRALGLDPAWFNDRLSGFTAGLFKNEDGEYVLAFRGSDDLSDWTLNNLPGALVTTPQQEEASRLGIAVRSHLEAAGVSSDQLSFTGHSLGGGLASAASLSTGCSAHTFNAAGLAAASIHHADSNRVTAFAENAPLAQDQAAVHSYVSADDPLTQVQDWTSAPDSFGTRTTVDPPGSPQAEAAQDTMEFLKRSAPWLGVAPLAAPDIVAGVYTANLADEELKAHSLDPLISELEKQKH